jgi:hypothetical protein
VRLSKSELLDIFRKWLSERALLECYFAFPDYEAIFRGKILEVTDDHVKVASDDTTSELALVLREWMSFAYGEPPKQLPKSADKYRSTILVFFEEPIHGKSDKRISFSELK